MHPLKSSVMKAHSFFLILTTGMTLLTSACQKTASDDLCAPSLNLEVFDSQLRSNLQTGLKGYTYLIMRDGQVKFTHSEGHARSPQDGLQPWDEFQTMHVASISKTISTVAALRLLKMKGLEPTEPIYKWLPPDWEIGNNVKNITFSDLMSHRTGFQMVLKKDSTLSTTYLGLKKLIAEGANTMKTRKYSNVHHALLRIILPLVADYPDISRYVGNENLYAQRYEQLVNQLVFQPLGITASLKDDDPNGGVLAYSSASDPSGEFETFNYQQTAGGYGWVLSARDLAKFWAYLWHSEVLLDESQRDYMKWKELGLYNSGDFSHGRYYCKLGGWFRKPEGDLEHWLRSAAIEFSDGTAVILFVNSPSSKGLRETILDAYEKSFGCF